MENQVLADRMKYLRTDEGEDEMLDYVYSKLYNHIQLERADARKEGKEEGKAEGKASGQASSVVSLMKAMDMPVEQALDTLSVSKEDRPAVLELVNAQLAMN